MYRIYRTKIAAAIMSVCVLAGGLVSSNTGDIYAMDEPTKVVKGVDKPVVVEAVVEPEVVEVVTEVVEPEELTVEERIIRACDVYDIPHDIPIAIARLETGWFKSDAFIYKNNVGGMSINEVPMTFDTLDEGVDTFVRNLAKNYYAVGLTTPEEIGAKYCPVNPDWASIVTALLEYEV